MIWKQFTHLGNFPPELKARFNSFLTTEFDDSLSVEMQLRSIIKWCQENFKTVDTLVDFINELSNWLKEFENNFDTKLEDSVIAVLSEWQQSGYIDVVISEAIQWELDDFKVTTEQNFLSVNQQLQQKPHVLNTVSDMINNTILKVGDTVVTLGYHSINDGGGATYLIQTKGLDSADGGYLIDLVGVATAQAIIQGKTITTRQLGLIEGNQCQDIINMAIGKTNLKKLVICDKLKVYKKGTGVTDLTQINVKSNMTLEFLPNTYLELNPSPNEDYYRMLNIANVTNVNVINPHLIGDVGVTTETVGEYGHGIYMVNAQNINIYNAKTEKMFGDGLGIANGKNINLYGTTRAEKCRRQGISIVAGSDIYIENIEGIDIKGNAPMAVVDIEPNNVNDHIKNVHIGRIYGENVVRALLITGGGNKEVTVGTIETNQENNDFMGYGEVEVHGNDNRVSLSVDKLISRNVTDKNIIMMVNTNENVDVSISEVVLDNYTRTASVLTTQLVPFLFEYNNYNASRSGKLYIGHITSKNIVMSAPKFDFYLNFLGTITTTPVIEDVYIPFINDQANSLSNFSSVLYKNSVIGVENKITNHSYLAGDMLTINPRLAHMYHVSKFDVIKVDNPNLKSFNLAYRSFEDYTLDKSYSGITKDTVQKVYWVTNFNGYIFMNHELKTISFKKISFDGAY